MPSTCVRVALQLIRALVARHRKRKRRKQKFVDKVMQDDPLKQSKNQGIPDTHVMDSDGDMADEFYMVDPVDNKCRRKNLRRTIR